MRKEIQMIGSGKYEVASHQQFTDREGNLVRTVKGSSKPIPVGEAYAFFDCSASREEIQREIPKIRSAVNTPSELELYLMNKQDVVSGNVELRQLFHEAREAGLKYVMKAQYPTATNSQTADELAAVLNQAYQSPLFKEGEQFRGAIFYKEKDRYVERD